MFRFGFGPKDVFADNKPVELYRKPDGLVQIPKDGAVRGMSPVLVEFGESYGQSADNYPTKRTNRSNVREISLGALDELFELQTGAIAKSEEKRAKAGTEPALHKFIGEVNPSEISEDHIRKISSLLKTKVIAYNRVGKQIEIYIYELLEKQDDDLIASAEGNEKMQEFYSVFTQIGLEILHAKLNALYDSIIQQGNPGLDRVAYELQSLKWMKFGQEIIDIGLGWPLNIKCISQIIGPFLKNASLDHTYLRLGISAVVGWWVMLITNRFKEMLTSQALDHRAENHHKDPPKRWQMIHGIKNLAFTGDGAASINNLVFMLIAGFSLTFTAVGGGAAVAGGPHRLKSITRQTDKILDGDLTARATQSITEPIKETIANSQKSQECEADPNAPECDKLRDKKGRFLFSGKKDIGPVWRALEAANGQARDTLIPLETLGDAEIKRVIEKCRSKILWHTVMQVFVLDSDDYKVAEDINGYLNEAVAELQQIAEKHQRKIGEEITQFNTKRNDIYRNGSRIHKVEIGQLDTSIPAIEPMQPVKLDPTGSSFDSLKMGAEKLEKDYGKVALWLAILAGITAAVGQEGLLFSAFWDKDKVLRRLRIFGKVSQMVGVKNSARHADDLRRSKQKLAKTKRGAKETEAEHAERAQNSGVIGAYLAGILKSAGHAQDEMAREMMSEVDNYLNSLTQEAYYAIKPMENFLKALFRDKAFQIKSHSNIKVHLRKIIEREEEIIGSFFHINPIDHIRGVFNMLMRAPGTWTMEEADTEQQAFKKVWLELITTTIELLLPIKYKDLYRFINICQMERGAELAGRLQKLSAQTGMVYDLGSNGIDSPATLESFIIVQEASLRVGRPHKAPAPKPEQNTLPENTPPTNQKVSA